MADFLSINITSRTPPVLVLEGYSNGNSPDIFMKIKSTTLELLPTEIINAMIVPSSEGMSSNTASGYLNRDSKPSDSPDDGIFYAQIRNNTSKTKSLSDNDFETINLKNWNYENVQFDLHYLQRMTGQSNMYGSGLGVYSYPHSLQGNEISLSAEPISGLFARYYIAFPEVNNSGDALYPTNGQPYQLGFHYKTRTNDTELFDSGVINGNPVEFLPLQTSGFAPPLNTGIVFDLPLYDPRNKDKLGEYEIYVRYKGPEGLEPTLLKIYSSHADLLEKTTTALETNIAEHVLTTDLQKVNELPIPAGIIERKRLVIGVKDIYVSQNSFEKQGVYVSPYYTNDTGLYTFTLKVKEYIPKYPDVDPYSTVRYFVEFNGLDWEPISPVSRNPEFDSTGKVIPKMIVFDSVNSTDSNIKYLNYSNSVISFRVKILFDITKVNGLVVPPEVKDYKCVIFDKTQLLEL